MNNDPPVTPAPVEDLSELDALYRQHVERSRVAPKG